MHLGHKESKHRVNCPWANRAIVDLHRPARSIAHKNVETAIVAPAVVTERKSRRERALVLRQNRMRELMADFKYSINAHQLTKLSDALETHADDNSEAIKADSSMFKPVNKDSRCKQSVYGKCKDRQGNWWM